MRTLVEHLSQYAHYHRDKRNIYTHFVGIPLIVISVLSLCSFSIGLFDLTGTAVLLLAVSAFYLRLDLKFGVLMLLFSGSCWYLATLLNSWAGGAVLYAAIAVFVVGWILQFIGHYYEGKKPAFVDDLIGLVIGPLFIVAEWAFMLGFAKELAAEIEQNAGPVRHS